MLDRVQRQVASYLTGEGSPAPDARRIVSLDATKGAIDGYTFLVFDPSGVAPELIAKAARTAAGRQIYRVEYANLERLEKIGMNADRPRTPRPLALRDDDDGLITLQSALGGTLMKNLPGAELFSADRARETLRTVVDWWLVLQERFGVERVRLDASRHVEEVEQPVRRFLARYLVGQDERRLLDRYLHASPLLDAELPWLVRHGDFCTANMQLADDGIGVFDWEFPLRRELPLFDLFYFVSSVRFPYGGYRGESSHLESFEAVFWGESYFAEAVRDELRRVAAELELEPERLADLLVLSLVQVAEMKYLSLMEAAGASVDADPSESASDADKRDRWASFARPDRDVPFACIRDGRFVNLQRIAERGLPRFG